MLKRIRKISSGGSIFMYLGDLKAMAEYYNLLEAMDAVAPQSLSPCFFVMTIVYFLTIVSKPTKQIMDDV
jgi:hypothetical protein